MATYKSPNYPKTPVPNVGPASGKLYGLPTLNYTNQVSKFASKAKAAATANPFNYEFGISLAGDTLDTNADPRVGAKSVGLKSHSNVSRTISRQGFTRLSSTRRKPYLPRENGKASLFPNLNYTPKATESRGAPAKGKLFTYKPSNSEQGTEPLVSQASSFGGGIPILIAIGAGAYYLLKRK